MGKSSKPDPTIETSDAVTRYFTAAEIAEALRLPSADFVKDLARKRKIGCIKMGHRTVRFIRSRVISDLAKLEIKAI